MSSKKLLALDEVRMDLIVMWEQGFEMGAAYGDPGEGGEPDDVPTDWRDQTIEDQGRLITKLTEDARSRRVDVDEAEEALAQADTQVKKLLSERDDWKDRALDLRGRIMAAATSHPDSEYTGDKAGWHHRELESLAYNVGRESRTWDDQ